MSERKSINIEGFAHTNPIPAASRIGNLLMSSVILGRDPVSEKLPADLKQQCVNMFCHVRKIVEAAELSIDDIIKITVWMKDPTDRAVLNEEWVKMFPDVGSRPARHTMQHFGDGEALILCDVTAAGKYV